MPDHSVPHFMQFQALTFTSKQSASTQSQRQSHQLLFSSAMIQTKTQLFLDCSWSSVDLINPSDAPSHLSQIWLREISGCLVIAFNFFVVKDWLKPVEANNWLSRGGVCVKHTQEAWISHEAYKSNKSSDPWRRNLIKQMTFLLCKNTFLLLHLYFHFFYCS